MVERLHGSSDEISQDGARRCEGQIHSAERLLRRSLQEVRRNYLEELAKNRPDQALGIYPLKTENPKGNVEIYIRDHEISF